MNNIGYNRFAASVFKSVEFSCYPYHISTIVVGDTSLFPQIQNKGQFLLSATSFFFPMTLWSIFLILISSLTQELGQCLDTLMFYIPIFALIDFWFIQPKRHSAKYRQRRARVITQVETDLKGGLPIRSSAILSNCVSFPNVGLVVLGTFLLSPQFRQCWLFLIHTVSLKYLLLAAQDLFPAIRREYQILLVHEGATQAECLQQFMVWSLVLSACWTFLISRQSRSGFFLDWITKRRSFNLCLLQAIVSLTLLCIFSMLGSGQNASVNYLSINAIAACFTFTIGGLLWSWSIGSFGIFFEMLLVKANNN